MAELGVTGTSQKQFVPKEGVTYQEIQAHGTEIQKKAFVLFDSNFNDKLEGDEFVKFQTAEYTLSEGNLTAYYDNREYTSCNVDKKLEMYNTLKKYNINLNPKDDLESV